MKGPDLSPIYDALIVKEEEADGDFRCVEPREGGGASEVKGWGPLPRPLLSRRDSRCMGLLKLAQLLDVVHQVAPRDILHHKIQAILEGTGGGDLEEGTR